LLRRDRSITPIAVQHPAYHLPRCRRPMRRTQSRTVRADKRRLAMSTFRISRRRLILGSALALPLTGLARAGDLIGPLSQQERQQFISDRRRDAALAELDNAPPLHATNGDEDRYPDRRASFSKTMPHNDLGEVEPEAYRKWLAILASGDPAEFEHAPRDPQAVERLNDPQATYAIDLVGPDASALQLPAPPAFASERMAAEMIELYWLALMRDVPFHEYSGNSLASAAVADLRAGGFAPLDAARLFRGETAGDVRGLFVSQFLWHDIPYGLKAVDQRFRVPAPDQAFGDITFGNRNLLTLLAQASLLAQKTSYYQKWQVHRRARPESFG